MSRVTKFFISSPASANHKKLSTFDPDSLASLLCFCFWIFRIKNFFKFFNLKILYKNIEVVLGPSFKSPAVPQKYTYKMLRILFIIFGVTEGIWTPNHSLHKRALFQLSYDDHTKWAYFYVMPTITTILGTSNCVWTCPPKRTMEILSFHKNLHFK